MANRFYCGYFRVVSGCTTMQELSDFALPYGDTQGLTWPVGAHLGHA